jgi:3-oxoacyl-[acyl-carrier protein] reductase
MSPGRYSTGIALRSVAARHPIRARRAEGARAATRRQIVISLAQSRALVTGASAGLGFGIASELASRGARVIMASRSDANLRAAVERIAARTVAPPAALPAPRGPAPIPIAADVTDPTAAEHLAAAAREQLGGLDILVCNAGGPPPGHFGELSDRHWEDAFRLILLAPIRLIRACLPQLRESGHGRIVLISSISGLRPVERLMLSNVLRPSLMGLARHLANELARDGILVNAIAPGFFDTERAREVQAAIAQSGGRSLREVQADLTAGIPLGRQGDPAELGRVVAFLASAENTYITGQTLVVDGGMLGSW